MNDADLEQRFHQRVLDAYCEAVRKCDMREARFLDMVAEYGGVRAVKRVLSNNQFHYRVTALVQCGHAEYSMEHLVLLPEFSELFTDQERLAARTRLNGGPGSGYQAPAERKLTKSQKRP